MTGVKATVRVSATPKSYRLRNYAQLQMNAKASPITSVGSVSPSVKWNLCRSVTWANVSGDWRAYVTGMDHHTVTHLHPAD